MSRHPANFKRRPSPQHQLEEEYRERKFRAPVEASPLAKRIAHFMRQSVKIQQLKRSSPSNGHNTTVKVEPVNGPCTLESIEHQIAQQNAVIEELLQGV